MNKKNKLNDQMWTTKNKKLMIKYVQNKKYIILLNYFLLFLSYENNIIEYVLFQVCIHFRLIDLVILSLSIVNRFLIE